MKSTLSARVLAQLGVDTQGTSSVEFERRWNQALGCKTSEVALGLLTQVVVLEHLQATATQDEIDRALMNATAAFGGARTSHGDRGHAGGPSGRRTPVGMTFLVRVGLGDQSSYGRDFNVQRATRLMRLFNEQLEAMAKLKGKSGQQRVVVEHVTVAAGGRAIVGAVLPGRGEGPDA